MKKQWFMSAAAALLVSFTMVSAMAGEVGVSIVFSDQEKTVIQAYYRDHSQDDSKKSQGNGKGKPGKSLPPGIAKNLARGKALPPGIAKQVLPSGLIALLPPPPRGFERVSVDGKVLLVDIATQIIHDKLEDLILH